MTSHADTVDTSRLGFGIGLRAPHFRDFLEERPRVDWLEVHTENVLDAASHDARVLEQLRADYPLSLHGVGLGLGSARGFSDDHLRRVRAAVDRFAPALVSEHLCWGAVADRHLNDLLPLVLGREALDLVCARVHHVQDVLRRRLLLENVSTYLRFRADAMSEAEFLAEVARRTGCGVLLDVNNLHVNRCNHGEDAHAALAAFAPGTIGEIHVAGHLVTADAVIDHHGAPVDAAVWKLYAEALRRFGDVPTLVEWDTDIPALEVLLAEAMRARTIADGVRAEAHPANDPVVLRTVAPGDACARKAEPNEGENAGGNAGGNEGDHEGASLAEAQAAFADALFDKRDEARALDHCKDAPPRNIQRLALYRGNLVASWTKALAGAYPVLQQLVGTEFFEALARAYGRAHPSQSGDLGRFGAHMAQFLESFPPTADYRYFPDVARLEWLLHAAHHADDRAPLAPAAFAALAAEEADGARLVFRPSTALFASDWAVVEIWRAHRRDDLDGVPEDIAQPCRAAVTLADGVAYPLILDAADHAALSCLQQGGTLGEAIDRAFDADPGVDIAASLQRWLHHQLFCAIELAR